MLELTLSKWKIFVLQNASTRSETNNFSLGENILKTMTFDKDLYTKHKKHLQTNNMKTLKK